MRRAMTVDQKREIARTILDDLMRRYKVNDVRGILRALRGEWTARVEAFQATQPTGPAPEKEQNE